MSLLSDAQKAQVGERLSGMVHPVRLAYYGQTLDCETCEDTRRLLGELPALNALLAVDELNLVLDRDAAAAHGVDRAPTIVVLGHDGTASIDYGVRFIGAPLGYEFSSLLDAILTVSRRNAELSEATVAKLAGLAGPVHFQVFSTPT